MIQIKDVTKLYPAKAAGTVRRSGERQGTRVRNGAIHALDHISLHVAQGEWLSIMGPSGSGKSTLVNLIGCLDRPTLGRNLARWRECCRHFGERTEPGARREDWIYLSAVSSDSVSYRGRERDAGAVLSQHDR